MFIFVSGKLCFFLFFAPISTHNEDPIPNAPVIGLPCLRQTPIELLTTGYRAMGTSFLIRNIVLMEYKGEDYQLLFFLPPNLPAVRAVGDGDHSLFQILIHERTHLWHGQLGDIRTTD